VLGEAVTPGTIADGCETAAGNCSERLPKEPLRCCPGEGIRRNGCFCHA
jgi:hypothetical protein